MEMSQQLPPTIAANIEGFTGRTWLLPEVVQWYESAAERVFLLTGRPGTGKSMILAWLAGSGPAPADPVAAGQLARVRSQAAAVHFCLAASRSNSPLAFADSMAGQLTRRVEGFGDALLATLPGRVEIHATQTVGTVQPGGTVTGAYVARLDLGALRDEQALDLAFTRPLKKLYESGYGRPLLLLLDALDEAETYTGTRLPALLAGLEDLPRQVRLLATTRPEPRILKYYRHSRPFDLTRDAPPDVDDVRVYALNRLAAQESLTREQAATFADRVAGASQGVFLYAAIVLDDLLSHPPGLPELDAHRALPFGLSGLYHDFLNRELGRDEDRWHESFKPLLGLIAVAQGEGLTRAQLAAITGKEVEGPLRVCQQYLSGEPPEGPFSIFHQSFADFLLKDERNRDYHVDAAAMHRLIAGYYWRTYGQDWQQIDAYGLDALALHLSQGGEGARLQELIALQWMAVRFEASGYTYDGFLADLLLAQQQAHDDVRGQIEAGQAPAALAACVRCALIRTSINTVSGNYAPQLVARAVETGLWPVERALSVAGRVPDHEGRHLLHVALLRTGRLNPEQTVQAREAALAAALAMDDEEFRAHALARLAPQLSGPARDLAVEQGLAAALALERHVDRARALAALAPQLGDRARAEALNQALADALAVLDEWDPDPELRWGSMPPLRSDRARALEDLAPHLSGEVLERGLAAALAMEDNWPRARALAALAPRLTDEAEVRALDRGLAAALAVEREDYRADALAALAPGLSGEALEQALAAALAMDDLGAQQWALVALAPRLSGAALERALDGALAIKATAKRAYALATLASHLDGEGLERALDAALAIEVRWAQAHVLAALAPRLSGEGLERALDAALATKKKTFAVIVRERLRYWVLSAGDNEHRARALAALAPRLRGETHAQVLKRALAAALAIEDEAQRVEVLAALVPQLSGAAQAQAVKRALAAAVAIRDEGPRARALATLSPHLTGPMLDQALAEVSRLSVDEWEQTAVLAALAPRLQGEALERGLTAALAIKNELARKEALVALAPHLHGQALERGLTAALTEDVAHQAHILAALLPRLGREALERGLRTALAIHDEWARAGALAALATHLSGQARAQAIEWGLEAALAVKGEALRADTLAALIPHTTGKAHTRAVRQALAAAIAKDGWPRAMTLAALAPQLNRTVRARVVQRALAAALSAWRPEDRSEALVALAPLLKGRALARALAATLDIEDERYRAEVLAELAPRLRGRALNRALTAALGTEDGWSRAWALAALAPRLSGEARAEALERALAAAMDIEDEWARATALGALAPQVSGEAHAQALDQGLAAALLIEDEEARGEALASLAPQLQGEALERGLAAAATGSAPVRAAALQAFLPVAPHRAAVLAGIRQAMADHLLNLAAARREAVLQFCAEETLFTPPLVDETTLAAIAGHIYEVCWEWQWM